MRKLFYLLIAMLVLMSCGNGSKKKNEENKAEEIYNPQIEMFARFKMKSSFHKTKRII